jgi:hypothetical protein
MNTWNPTLFCDFRDSLSDLSIGFGCRVVFALRDLIGDRCVLSDHQSRVNLPDASGLYGHPDFLLATERQHLPLLFAVD